MDSEDFKNWAIIILLMLVGVSGYMIERKSCERDHGKKFCAEYLSAERDRYK